MADCDQIIEQLHEHLRPGGGALLPLTALLEHLVVCPRCQSAARALVQALRLNVDDEFTCEEVEARLPEYTLADPAGVEWAEVRVHLATCPHCAADYLELLAMEHLAEEDVAPVARPTGRPQLDFLPHRRQAARPIWRFDELGRLIVAFSREVLTAMLAAAPTPPALAVKSAPELRPGGRLTLGGAPENLEATVTINERADDPASCTLLVEVRIPSRGGWPNLAGSEVRVAIPGCDELIRITDAFGRVAITPLTRDEIAALTMTIVPVA